MVTGIVAAILALLTSALSTVQAPTGSFPTPDSQPQAIERPASIREEIATLRQAIRDLVALHASGREQIPGGFELTPPEMPFQSNSEPAPEDGCRTHESYGATWAIKTTTCSTATSSGGSTSSSQSSTSKSSVTVRTGDSP